jgi:hypothetical protein
MRLIISEEEKRQIKKLYEVEGFDNVETDPTVDPKVREFSLMVFNYLNDKKDRDLLFEKYYQLKKEYIEKNDSVSANKLDRYYKKIDLKCDDLFNYINKLFVNITFLNDDEKNKDAQFIKNLLKEKNCITSKTYLDNLKILMTDQEGVEYLTQKAEHEKTIGSYDESIKTYNTLITKTTSISEKENFKYKILEIYFNDKKDYKKSYSIAMKITGTYKNSSLQIAAKCVNKYSWDNCGLSTFDRCVNYIYAARLAASGSDYNAAATYMAKAPCQVDWFSEEMPKNFTLSCWVDPNTNLPVTVDLGGFYKLDGEAINPYSKMAIKCKRPENRTTPFNGNVDFE